MLLFMLGLISEWLCGGQHLCKLSVRRNQLEFVCASSFALRQSPITRSLRCRCSETCLSSRVTTMAEAAGRGHREQPGYFVCSAEFLPCGEEGPPFHPSQLQCRRRRLRSDHGPLARTVSGGREQSHATRERRL